MSAVREETAGRFPWARSRRRESPRELVFAGLHLFVLAAFALAQPLFDLLSRSPEFFVVRGSTRWDIVVFVLAVTILPAAILLALEALAGLAGPGARWTVHLVFVGALAGLFALQALKRVVDGPGTLLIVLAALLGGAGALAYRRVSVIRSFLTVLAPAPLVFLALFLFTDPVSKLAFPDEAQARTIGGVTRAPVVMVLFDELPVTTLMDGRGRIDAERFPGFGELARSATWFKNAYTVYDSTERAQPAIMDGNLPERERLPTSADHPNSIFTLFAKTHRLNVSEEATSVCPRDLCRDERLEESYGSRMSSMSEDLGLV